LVIHSTVFMFRRNLFWVSAGLMLSTCLFGQLPAVKPQYKEKKVLLDLQERVIRDESGNKINYPYSVSSENKPVDTQQRISSTASNKVENTVDCNNGWNFTVMGTYIGDRSLKSLDIDHDGKIETIASARYDGYYFYTMQYNAITSSYEHTWVSPTYTDQITYINCSDVNNDSIYEIFVGFTSGKIIEYDGSSKNIIRTLSITANNAVNDIEFGDADNDGIKELVVSSIAGFFFFDVSSFSLIHQITTYGTYDFKIGNVDNDPANEIVLSAGSVLQYDGVTATLQWTYEATNSIYGLIELSDIDQDGKKEIIKAEQWYTISVYDADIQSLKYAITTSQDIGALSLADVNNDGIDEILYGDGQWGSLHCLNAKAGAQMWDITNPNSDFTGISIADVDQDGNLEALWGAGQNSTGGDTLYVYSVVTKLQKWRSKDIDGPFYGVEIADVDNDGALEIIAVSNESESSYGSGIISVFDANTHKLEWQCNGEFLLDVWTGIWDLKVIDIDNDGIQEIIIAADYLYTGKIWIINGVTKAIKSSYTYSAENLSNFSTLDIADVDNDGKLDLVAINNQVNIIDPVSFAIKWSSTTGSYGSNSKILIDNVDQDPNKEIVVIDNNNVNVFDGVTHQLTQWTNGYSTFDLFDMNKDSIKDIVCGTTSGNITIIDVANNKLTSLGTVCSNSLEGLKVSYMVNTDTVPQILFTSQGTLYVKTQTNGIIQLGAGVTTIAGNNNSLKTVDVNNDGKKEIFVGTGNSVYELSSSCYQCIWFGNSIIKSNVSCISSHDGAITNYPKGGTPPYYYSGSAGIGASSITNLNTGTYYITVSDNGGCSVSDTVTIAKAPSLIAHAAIANINCMHTKMGSALINISQGTAPYTYAWSNGANASKDTILAVGNYTVIIRDTMQCRDTLTFKISIDSLKLSTWQQNITCYGDSNGYINATITEGIAPFTYKWSNGLNTYYDWHLPSGRYILTVQDARGCNNMDTFIITQPGKPLTVMVTTGFDNPATAAGDGSALVTISGGTPPYALLWNDPFAQTSSSVTNLLAGNYVLDVRDTNGCENKVAVTIELSSNTIKAFPNPAKDFITVEISNIKPAVVHITDAVGRELIEPKSFIQQTTINTYDFAPATYFLNVKQADNTQTLKFTVYK
jgi:hypothetical protein